jgi:hypothetical protein
MSRPELLSATIESLNELDSPDDRSLVELVHQISPEFATIIKLAHLDELVDYLDDLLILVPTGHDEFLREMARDPLASPEDWSDFVLRHILRMSDLRLRFLEGDVYTDHELLIEVENLAHEKLLLATRDDSPVAVNGIDLDVASALDADNGTAVAFPGLLDPPDMPGLVFPDLDT